jgi:hypothetical protein
MVEKTEQNLELIKNHREMSENEVFEQHRLSHQTNPIARKLLDFSNANKTRRFSVKDLFTR